MLKTEVYSALYRTLSNDRVELGYYMAFNINDDAEGNVYMFLGTIEEMVE